MFTTIHKSGDKTKRRLNINSYSLALFLVWTVLILSLSYYHIKDTHDMITDIAVKEARTHFNRDQAFRYWGASHGGVYVPIDENTPPNVNLSHIKERNIETPSGVKLTLMNPAYMVRQMGELYSDMYGVSGRITSLKPLRKLNTPDEWERKALLSFEKGVNEVFELSDINGEPYLRLMRPMITKEPCLKCHAFQGYKVGDIRGGIGISLPMAPYYEKEYEENIIHIVSYFFIWIIGALGIGIGFKRLKQRIQERQVMEEQREELIRDLELVNAELTDFAHTVSHDLKAPLRGIISVTKWISKDYKNKFDEDGRKQLKLLENRTRRMHDLITGILEYSRIGRTKKEKERIDMDKVVLEVIDAIVPEDDVNVEIEGKLPVVMFEEHYAKQLFQNLISNAVKYMDKPEKEIRIGCVEDKLKFTFSVSDNGIGIEERDFERIFKIFQTVEPYEESKSSGVGLSIVKKIVNRYGGKIWVESKIGKRSTFFFTIPKILS
jgi:signal transduction histidine kinase